MAYGCKPAVTVVTCLLHPIKAFLHKHGIKFSIYIDDGRVLAATPQLCSEQMQFTLLVLQLAGWKVQWKKTTLIPTERLLHLGFITDSVQMTYSVTPEKWEAVRLSLAGLIELARTNLSVPVKDIASVLGKVGALHRFHGSIVRVLSRSLQHQLVCHVEECSSWSVLHNSFYRALHVLLCFSSTWYRIMPCPEQKIVYVSVESLWVPCMYHSYIYCYSYLQWFPYRRIYNLCFLAQGENGKKIHTAHNYLLCYQIITALDV